MEIDVHEVTEDRADLVDALTEVRNDTITDVSPDDPAAPAAEVASELFNRTTHVHTRSWVAFVDGTPAGEATFDLEDDDENRHIAGSDWFAVRHRVRRRGVADALLRTVLDACAAEGRTTLHLWSPVLEPDVGHAYASRLGLTPALEERCSRLAMTDLPEPLIVDWLSAGRDRSDGYRIVQFGGRCPDELLPPFLEAIAAMDDMPTDELEWTVARTDEELVRSREHNWERRRLVLARTLALAPDGAGAGFSELFVCTHRPTLAYQGDTGVVPTHRGRGLGRWLKAENLRYAQRVAAGFEVIETHNAQSNPWMLDINVAMGFRPHVVYRAYQGDLAAARAVLG